MDINTAVIVTDGNGNEFSTEDVFFQTIAGKLVTHHNMAQSQAENLTKSIVLTLMDSVSFAKRTEESAERKQQ